MNPTSGDVPSETPKPELLDQVRQHLWVLHDSIRTEDAYVQRIRRFNLFRSETVKNHSTRIGLA